MDNTHEQTRHGGVRRTRLAHWSQKTGTETSVRESFSGASLSDSPGAEVLETSKERPRYTRKAGRFDSPIAYFKNNFIFKWKETLGLSECPYLIRWRIETPWGSVRLHHWIGSDDPRNFHDHPWNFITLVLKGGYTDVSPDGEQHLKAGKVQYRDALHQHTVYPDKGGCWTIIFTSPKIRPWGFWVNGKFRKANKYFLSHGHHPCE